MGDSKNVNSVVGRIWTSRPARRAFLIGTAGVVAAGVGLAVARVFYNSNKYGDNGWEKAFDELVAQGEEIDGSSIELDLTDSSDDGTAVPYSVSVNPIGETFPKSLTIYAPGNPFPRIATFEFSEALGVASIESKMRLGGPQELVLVADMGNGQLAVRRHFIDVLAGGC